MVFHKNLANRVAQKIKSIRLDKEMTQEEAAEASGFHYKYYQKIESGTANLTLESLEKLAKAFRCDPKEFL